jgi:hypothetical protein
VNPDTALVISLSSPVSAIVSSGMTHYPQINALRRATRIQLTTAPAIVKLNDGVRTKGKLQVVSTTGGLLQLTRALSDGDFVEVAFQTHSGNVRGMAEMLSPVRSAPGSVFQPFRFVAMGDDDHRTLDMMIQSEKDRRFVGLRSREWLSGK